jgi:hypothetical protein
VLVKASQEFFVETFFYRFGPRFEKMNINFGDVINYDLFCNFYGLKLYNVSGLCEFVCFFFLCFRLL